MQLRNGFMKITWLLMMGSVKIHKKWDFYFQRFSNEEQKILGVIVDNKLTFKSHIKNLCKIASQKIATLSRLSNHLNNSQKRLIFNSLVKSQFSYCPLVWMFCSNNMINKVHERAIKVLLNDHESDFETLLKINNEVSNHHRNIQTLLIEIFKIKKGFASPIKGSILKVRNFIRAFFSCIAVYFFLIFPLSLVLSGF